MKRLGKALVWSYLPVMLTLLVASVLVALAQTPVLAPVPTQADFNGLVAKRVVLRAEFKIAFDQVPGLADQQKDVHAAQVAYDAALAKHNEWANNPPSLAERNAHDAQTAKLATLIADQIAKVTALNVRIRDYKQRRDAHNANRCYYPPNNPSYCDGYNKEQEAFATEAASLTAEGTQLDQLAAQYNGQKAELDAQKGRFAAENDRIDADAKVVDEQGRKLNAALADYKAKLVPLNKPWQENETKIVSILTTLKAAGVKTDDCQVSLKDTQDSAVGNIQTVCGKMFGGKP